MSRYCILFSLLLLAAAPARAEFDIQLVFDASVTDEQKTYFELGAQTWESYITGYQPGIGLTGITIDVSTPNLPDPGGTDILGQANATAFVNQGGYRLTQAGYMEFDVENVDDLIDQGYFDEVVIHEMGHVIGIGINWISNGVYVNGSGRYTGQYGLAAYNADYGQSGTFIPVELAGGAGTANKHWDEVNNGAALTGITDYLGRDLTHELMTGWLNVGQPPYVSNMTVQSLRDIGFEVVNLRNVPEPTTLVTVATMLAVGVAFRQRRYFSRQV